LLHCWPQLLLRTHRPSSRARGP